MGNLGRIGVAFGALCLVTSCSSNSTDRPADSFDRAAMLTDYGANIVIPTYLQISTASASLGSSLESHCQAIGTASEGDAQATSQAAWRELMTAWQTAEVMQVGPVSDNAGDLHDSIYSWPVTSTCAIDIDADAIHRTPGTFSLDGKLPNRRGLDALEYLLFTTDLNHSCSPQNAPAGWNELPSLDRSRARCNLALAMATEIAASSAGLLETWNTGYGSALAQSGREGGAFPKAQDALNRISDALFYLDGAVKDMKLAEPAGITVNRCGMAGVVCPEELEARLSGFSKASIRSNLVGYQAVFLGQFENADNGIGFEEFLTELGGEDLALQMKDDIEAAIASVDAIPGTLEDAIQSAPNQVEAAHTAIRTVTDNMKSQFLTILGLDLPDSAAGDND